MISALAREPLLITVLGFVRCFRQICVWLHRPTLSRGTVLFTSILLLQKLSDQKLRKASLLSPIYNLFQSFPIGVAVCTMNEWQHGDRTQVNPEISLFSDEDECWFLSAPSGRVVFAEVRDFHLEDSQSCTADSLQFRDGRIVGTFQCSHFFFQKTQLNLWYLSPKKKGTQCSVVKLGPESKNAILICRQHRKRHVAGCLVRRCCDQFFQLAGEHAHQICHQQQSHSSRFHDRLLLSSRYVQDCSFPYCFELKCELGREEVFPAQHKFQHVPRNWRNL